MVSNHTITEWKKNEAERRVLATTYHTICGWIHEQHYTYLYFVQMIVKELLIVCSAREIEGDMHMV